MSSERISIQDLIERIAKQSGRTKKTVEDFIRQLVVVIENGLSSDDSVKIKGLGTFKLVWNEARKSVNVQTGEEIEMPGYNKITFTPENSLKDIINSPYAHLEAVNLDEADEPKVKKINPLEKLNEQAEEIKDIISELNLITPKEESKGEEENKEEAIADIVEEKPAEPLFAPATPPSPAPPPVVVESPVISVAPAYSPPVYIIPETKKKKKKFKIRWWIILLLLLLLIGSAVACYLFGCFPQKITKEIDEKCNLISEKCCEITQKCADWFDFSKEKEVEIEETPVEEEITAALDENIETTEAADTIQTLEPEPEPELEPDIFSQPREYKEFKSTEFIVEGIYLAALARKHYGVTEFWVYIYEANKQKISHPNKLSFGTLVKIPILDPRLIDKNNPACLEYAKQLEKQYLAN